MTESLLRERDEPIPGDEDLFRSVAPEDVVDGEVVRSRASSPPRPTT